MTSDSSNTVADADRLAELQHRMRNTLATTRAIVRRSAETSENLEDYVAHLDGRLAALARVQNAAIQDTRARIDLGMLVMDELTSAGLSNSRQVKVDGPPLLLHPRAADPFALALHELMTNAIKFGALSTQSGRLTVSWQIEAGGEVSNGEAPEQLVFDWIESGMNLDPNAPRRSGFGTIVLTEMLKHEMSASTRTSFDADGHICRISVPLTERVVASAKPSASNDAVRSPPI